MSVGPRDHTPVIPAVHYPGHFFYVPLELWGLATAGALTATLFFGIATGTGMQVFIFLPTWAALLVAFGIAYRRDRHVVALWRIRFVRGHPHPARVRPEGAFWRRRGHQRYV